MKDNEIISLFEVRDEHAIEALTACAKNMLTGARICTWQMSWEKWIS